MKRQSVIALFALLLGSAAFANPEVNALASAWRSRLETELPLGSSRAAVLAWASRNHVQLGEGSEEPRQLIVPIGYVKEKPAPAFGSLSSVAVCDGWGVSAALVFNADNQLVKRDVRTRGHCL